MNIKHSKSIILKEKVFNPNFNEILEDHHLKISKSFNSKYTIPINGCTTNSLIKKVKKVKKINKEIIHDNINNKKFRYNTKKYEPLQINLLKKLEEKENSTESLLEELKNLKEQCPIINKFSDSKILYEDDFDIFDCEDFSKFTLVLNASNTINIVNFLWGYFSGDIESLVTLLAELKIFFSYVREENSFDKINCILITSIPSFLYNFISTNAESQFKNKKMNFLAKNYAKSKDKSKLDSEYCYQSMISLNFLEKAGIENNETNPTVIYYLKPGISQKLIDLKIIIPPKKYSLHSLPEKNKSKKGKDCEVINLSISLKNEVILYQDYNFTIINGKNVSPIGQKIVLKEGFTYIIAIAINIEDIIKNIKHIIKIEKRFIEAYNNIVVNETKLYDIKNYQLLLMSDNNLNDSGKKLLEKLDTKCIKKNIDNFIYSSPQLGISIILNLQKVIRGITTELKEMKKEVNKKNKEIEKIKKEIDQIKEINNKDDENNYKESKLSLKMLVPPDIPKIINNLKNNDFHNINELNSIYNCFNTVSKYLKAYKKDLLFHKIFPLIGELKSLEKKNELEKINYLIKEKINEKKIWSNYYQGLFELLIESENMKEEKENDYNSFCGCDSDFIIIIEKLIIFIEVLEDNARIANIESIYKGALLLLGYSFLGNAELLKLINSEPSEQLFFRKLIISGKNAKFSHKDN